MKIKFRSIEFFGVSGSGKSFIRSLIQKKLKTEGFQVYDTREMIIYLIDKLIPLKLSQKIYIFFFQITIKI